MEKSASENSQFPAAPDNDLRARACINCRPHQPRLHNALLVHPSLQFHVLIRMPCLLNCKTVLVCVQDPEYNTLQRKTICDRCIYKRCDKINLAIFFRVLTPLFPSKLLFMRITTIMMIIMIGTSKQQLHMFPFVSVNYYWAINMGIKRAL